jgi:group II intron reverse transcriptase/maturase
MRDAETVLSIIRDRGSKGLPLEDIYRQLYNPELYRIAYGKIYRNHGALTPGVTEETVDGMSLEKIQVIIDALREERYGWSPARRVHIAKKNSTKKRPLGLPTWSDKLLQEVLRMILEAYFEPQFSDHSHGFRPNRGCHTALTAIRRKWAGTTWFIEGDISQCFDRLDHEILMSMLREKLRDNRFLRLIENLLKAGYLEEWKYNATLSGSPQGGVVSPILANIYLDRLDRFVEQELLPAYNQEKLRKRAGGTYKNLIAQASRARKRGERTRADELLAIAQQMPSTDPNDPDYRRLHYVRYADDFLLGFAGPRHEAEQIKQQLGQFLRDHLKLELSEPKTSVTHARSCAARFLGYEIVTLHDNTKHTQGGRSINGRVGLKVPEDVVKEKCEAYLWNGNPMHRTELLHNSDFSIISEYQAIYRGTVQYYQLAFNLASSMSKLKWVMQVSLTKTLAGKFKISVPEVYQRYRTTIETDKGPRRGLGVTIEREGKKPLRAVWGGISLAYKKTAVLNDQPPKVWNTRTEIVERLLADTCELCGSQEEVQVHHIKALKHLRKARGKEIPEWKKEMAARKRKTLVVCRRCHNDIHWGRLQRTDKGTLESRMN